MRCGGKNREVGAFLHEVSSNLRKVRSFDSKSTESTNEISIDEQDRSADSSEAKKAKGLDCVRLRREKAMHEKCSRKETE